MIYVSHLIPDEELKKIINKYQTGVESIEFSISENLDHLSESIVNYQKTGRYGKSSTDASWPFSGYQSCCL